MKKITACILAIVIIGCFTLTAMADSVNCNIKIDSFKTKGDCEITVPVVIDSNSGFTNFAIALDYDHEVLELRDIQTKDQKGIYLCGETAGVSTNWIGEDGREYGYISCAQSEKVTDEGILFTAVFYVKDGFFEKTTITPIIKYMRNNEAVFSIFEEIRTTAATGTVEYDAEALSGDVNGDGDVTPADAAKVYKSILGAIELTEKERQAADINKDDNITVEDVNLIFEMTIGK